MTNFALEASDRKNFTLRHTSIFAKRPKNSPRGTVTYNFTRLPAAPALLRTLRA
jgi:hypothetical protein